MLRICNQIMKMINEYEMETGRVAEKISISREAYDLLLQETSHLVIHYAEKRPSTLFGYPLEIVNSSPCGYVSIGPMKEVYYYDKT